MTTEALLRNLALAVARLEKKLDAQLANHAKIIGRLEAQVLLLKKENQALSQVLFDLGEERKEAWH